MATARRIGAESSKTRTNLLDATEQLMRDEGYAAVSSRQVAAKAGLKPQLVHYYFRTMDDLFLAVFQRLADQLMKRQTQVLISDQPLRGLWELSNDASIAVLSTEFMALANHRKVIRAEIARFGELFRDMRVEVLTRILKKHRVGTGVCPPISLAVVLESLARVLVLEGTLGMSKGHAETRALVERYIKRFEVRQPTKKRVSAQRRR
ncbi:MAG: TetR/AcrR family transcriptional regulator [Rhodospirillaceae bacterium]|nr:MAG: TetR/AcrR family transcriptional regulator [Rhodospirillaceae bacterium]